MTLLNTYYPHSCTERDLFPVTTRKSASIFLTVSAHGNITMASLDLIPSPDNAQAP